MPSGQNPRQASLSGRSRDHHLGQDDVCQWFVARIAGDITDRFHHVVPPDHLAEDRVLAIQPWSGLMDDEKLAAVAIGAGISHGEDAGPVVTELWVKLVRESVPRAAAPNAERVTALDHEVRNHPVKDGTVIERPLHLLSGLRIGPGLGAGGER